MEFKDKYSTKSNDVFICYDKEGKEVQIPKEQISKDAYALGELLDKLNQILIRQNGS
jgi:hypothetical protein